MQKRPLIFTLIAVFGYFAFLQLATYLKTNKSSVNILKLALKSENVTPFSGTLTTTMASGEKKLSSQVQVWQGNGMKYIHKGKKTVSVPVISPEEAGKRARRILKNYTVQLQEDGGAVAGRATYLLSIHPKHPGNFSKKLWVDKLNFFILKMEDVNEQGGVTARSEYNTIAYISGGKHEAAQDILPAAYKPVETLESLSQKLAFHVREPKNIPEGYAMEKCHLFECPDHCGMKAAQIVYSDGLNSFSVFEVQPEMSGCSKLSHCYKMCKLKKFPECLVYKDSPFTTVVSLASTNPSYVFVGNLPKETFLAMAETVKNQRAGSSVQGAGKEHEHE